MGEALHLLLVGLVVASLLVVVAYVAGFLVLAVVTAFRRRRPDPLSLELDRALDEILSRAGEPPDLATSVSEAVHSHAGTPARATRQSERRSQ